RSSLYLIDLRRTGSQLLIAESLDHIHGTYHRRVLLRNVELDDFGAGQRARVGEPYRYFDFLAVGDGLGRKAGPRQLEGGVGEPVPEGEERLDALGVVPAVAYQHSLGVGNVVKLDEPFVATFVVELSVGRNGSFGRRVGELLFDGYRQFARRVQLAGEHFR